MSNMITEEQVAKNRPLGEELAGGRVALLFDADDASEAHWVLAECGLDVRLLWS
ncbi:MAG TPA: hypothetical protein VHR66_20250 [Gemmataceae bacterium]|jgi:hypothetical protein|nr:hypothetical protein [Gemmataceae bacterium]